jgi:hypothetical protein
MGITIVARLILLCIYKLSLVLSFLFLSTRVAVRSLLPNAYIYKSTQLPVATLLLYESAPLGPNAMVGPAADT